LYTGLFMLSEIDALVKALEMLSWNGINANKAG
jgi:hypothetical protein